MPPQGNRIVHRRRRTAESLDSRRLECLSRHRDRTRSNQRRGSDCHTATPDGLPERHPADRCAPQTLADRQTGRRVVIAGPRRVITTFPTPSGTAAACGPWSQTPVRLSEASRPGVFGEDELLSRSSVASTVSAGTSSRIIPPDSRMCANPALRRQPPVAVPGVGAGMSLVRRPCMWLILPRHGDLPARHNGPNCAPSRMAR